MMKHIAAVLAAIVALTSVSLAECGPEASAQDTKKMVQNNFVETAQKGMKLSGYVDSGYSYNFTGNSANPSTVNGRFGSDSAQRGDFNMYAVKLTLEKEMTSENIVQAGFRTDVMIGEDAAFLIDSDQEKNGTNNEYQNSNVLFLEQAYVCIRVPLGNGWDFKVGKFVSPFGYEMIERPSNLNTTYGLLWNQYPFYYSGVLSSYKFDQYLDGKLGVVNGSNTDNNTSTANTSDGCALVASLNVTAPESNASWSNNFQYTTNPGNDTVISTSRSTEIANAQPSSSGFYVLYNSFGSWAPKFASDKLLLAFDSALGSYNSPTVANTWYGAAAYAKYQFNDWFSLASRGEYLGSNNDANFGVNGSTTTQGTANVSHATGNNLWEYTLTAGFRVVENLLIRAEYRLDWGAGSVGGTAGVANFGTPAVSGSGGPAHYAGTEVVYSF